MKFNKHYILDTNILLEDANNIFTLSDNGSNLIILPEIVLDEIDSKKSGYDEINFQAREFARILEDADILDTLEEKEHKIVNLKIQDTIIAIISKEEYQVNNQNSSKAIINDRKILEISKFANEYYTDVELISLDIMIRIRAISLGLKTSSLKGKVDDEFDFEFIKEAIITYDDLATLDYQPITKFDEEYSYHNFSYNLKVKDSDQVVLSVIQNGKIKILDEDDLRDQIIMPLNTEQLYFSHAIIDKFYDVIIVEAKAGSGKTLLALSGAMKLIKLGWYKKIIYIRNSIESLDKGEDVGYLPGLEEKFAIYNHPLMDSLEYIVTQIHKKNRKNKDYKELDEIQIKQRVSEIIELYAIETMWVGEMRGRTLSNAVVIIDEAQNMSNKTMQMVLSRIDKECKVIILGSNKQIDNFYVNKYTNSLTTLLNSTKDKSELVNTFAISLQKVLRGNITEWAEEIFSK